MEALDHEAKLRDCLDYALPQPESEAVLEQLDRLEDLSAAEVQSLLRRLSP